MERLNRGTHVAQSGRSHEWNSKKVTKPMQIRGTPSLRLSLVAALFSAAFLGCQAYKNDAPTDAPKPAPAAAPSAELKGYVKVAAETPLPKATAQEFPGIHNFFKLSDHVYSGSEPDGEVAMKKLAELGVKTIVSVDSKVPDAELAKKYGMRYVHIPFGYHGIGEDDEMALAKTFRELQGPFYTHCFHGKHRGPAAAAIGRIVLDGAPREQALAEMYQWCGTAKNYTGLFNTVGTFKVPTVEETQKCSFDFPAAAPVGDFVDVMVHVGRAEDALKKLDKRGYAADPQHPDVDAENEAVKLSQAFRSAMTLPEWKTRPEDFKAWAVKSETLANDLAAAVRSFKSGEAAASGRANEIYTRIAATCVDCHNVYRNFTPVAPH